ncbi:Oidioi.mRNA.OKI2018_I69.PAR.g10873.t1.cds [Oikopleura dioica]|uniref:Oidioi.mRNA.OKI2018_I69.PAR.g10873.t1.cds n=1 Tax=Oikopleura dioica TaxID=34765 RepID=A0ABN7RWD9_OIKDI|nr:Oidioi.mRNA.OKI2018_I69.PAR.g10873.t1.cds [Oikopleura dioica]
MSNAHRFDGHQNHRDSPSRPPPQNHPQAASGWIDEPPKPWYFLELDALFNSRNPLFQPMRSFIGRPEFYDERPEIQREIFAREKERLIQEDLLEKDNIINIIKRVSNEALEQHWQSLVQRSENPRNVEKLNKFADNVNALKASRRPKAEIDRAIEIYTSSKRALNLICEDARTIKAELDWRNSARQNFLLGNQPPSEETTPRQRQFQEPNPPIDPRVRPGQNISPPKRLIDYSQGDNKENREELVQRDPPIVVNRTRNASGTVYNYEQAQADPRQLPPRANRGWSLEPSSGWNDPPTRSDQALRGKSPDPQQWHSRKNDWSAEPPTNWNDPTPPERTTYQQREQELSRIAEDQPRSRSPEWNSQRRRSPEPRRRSLERRNSPNRDRKKGRSSADSPERRKSPSRRPSRDKERKRGSERRKSSSKSPERRPSRDKSSSHTSKERSSRENSSADKRRERSPPARRRTPPRRRSPPQSTRSPNRQRKDHNIRPVSNPRQTPPSQPGPNNNLPMTPDSQVQQLTVTVNEFSPLGNSGTMPSRRMLAERKKLEGERQALQKQREELHRKRQELALSAKRKEHDFQRKRQESTDSESPETLRKKALESQSIETLRANAINSISSVRKALPNEGPPKNVYSVTLGMSESSETLRNKAANASPKKLPQFDESENRGQTASEPRNPPKNDSVILIDDSDDDNMDISTHEEEPSPQEIAAQKAQELNKRLEAKRNEKKQLQKQKSDEFIKRLEPQQKDAEKKRQDASVLEQEAKRQKAIKFAEEKARQIANQHAVRERQQELQTRINAGLAKMGGSVIATNKDREEMIKNNRLQREISNYQHAKTAAQLRMEERLARTKKLAEEGLKMVSGKMPVQKKLRMDIEAQLAEKSPEPTPKKNEKSSEPAKKKKRRSRSRSRDRSRSQALEEDDPEADQEVLGGDEDRTLDQDRETVTVVAARDPAHDLADAINPDLAQFGRSELSELEEVPISSDEDSSPSPSPKPSNFNFMSGPPPGMGPPVPPIPPPVPPFMHPAFPPFAPPPVAAPGLIPQFATRDPYNFLNQIPNVPPPNLEPATASVPEKAQENVQPPQVESEVNALTEDIRAQAQAFQAEKNTQDIAEPVGEKVTDRDFFQSRFIRTKIEGDKVALIIRGLPGSGKTTVARKIEEMERANGKKVKRLDFVDEFKEDKHDDPDFTDYEKREKRENFFLKMEKELRKSKYNVIIVEDIFAHVTSFEDFYATAVKWFYKPFVIDVGKTSEDVVQEYFLNQEMMRSLEMCEYFQKSYQKTPERFNRIILRYTFDVETDIEYESGECTTGESSQETITADIDPRRSPRDRLSFSIGPAVPVPPNSVNLDTSKSHASTSLPPGTSPIPTLAPSRRKEHAYEN